MIQALQQKLKDRWDSFTASEQKIATYLLQHLRDLPFETAASLSKRVQVSPMTVGRFLRALGYEGVGQLKEEMRGHTSWQRLYQAPRPSEGAEAGAPHPHLEAEIRNLTAIHSLPATPEWKGIVKLLATSERVTVGSFHNITFLGEALASLLQDMRPGVYFTAGRDGAYVDMLLDSHRNCCVALIDARRYFRQFRVLAEAVVKRGIPLILIVDTDCHWAREITPHVLMLNAERLWHSYTAHISLFSLLASSLSEELDDVMKRLGDVTELRQQLVGYETGAGRPRSRPARAMKFGGTRKFHKRS